MRHLVTLVLATLIALDCMAATDPDIYRLKSEVAQLRNQVRYLEQQVRMLEAQMRQQRSQPIPPAPIIATSPWHQMRTGMSKDQVTLLLGEPTEQDFDADGGVWCYTRHGRVEFDSTGRVSRWETP
ncbi:MAG: outer membrane protein assembly factor BamE [Pseudomonadales bacterium]